MLNEKRIYAVVARTVQVPLLYDGDGISTPSRKITEDGPRYRCVLQPSGRQVAQVAPAVSLLRMQMLRRQFCMTDYKSNNPYEQPEVFGNDVVTAWNSLTIPITTIVLEASDSFELNHVRNLLVERFCKQLCPAPVVFYDTQQADYGSLDEYVPTALAIGPVTENQVLGILDYLPLWE